MRASLSPALLDSAVQRIWTERLNSIDWTVRTVLGPFMTHDRSTWHTPDHAWAAAPRRSRNRRHVYLAVFYEGSYGWPETGWRQIGCCVASTRAAVLI
jgi:hypothetical protein